MKEDNDRPGTVGHCCLRACTVSGESTRDLRQSKRQARAVDTGDAAMASREHGQPQVAPQPVGQRRDPSNERAQSPDDDAEHQRKPTNRHQLQVDRHAPVHGVEGGRGRDHHDGRTKQYVASTSILANITNVKIGYRCSYYRVQLRQGKLELHVQLMDYDEVRAVPHTCTPPNQPLPLQNVVTPDVTAEMQRAVDQITIEGTEILLQI